MTDPSPNPRVSIGVPVHNGERYVDDTLAALAKQTFQDFEVIISDNASSDSTPAIAQDWVERDSRFRYFRTEQNRGAAWNFNRVFELSSGEFFKWAAHDDLILPTYLEACVAALDADPDAVLAHTRVQRIDADGAPDHSRPIHYTDVTSHDRILRLQTVLFEELSCLPVFGLIRSQALQDSGLIGAFDSSDRVLLGELALRGPFRLIDQNLLLNRQHDRSSMRSYRGRYERGAWFDPRNARISYLPNWLYLINWVRSANRAGLAASERLGAYKLFARWSAQNWAKLAFDPVRVSLEAVIAGCEAIIRRFGR